MKTREEFIAAWRHKVTGWIVDATVTQRNGAPLAEWLRLMMKTVDRSLAEMYDEVKGKADDRPQSERSGPTAAASGPGRVPAADSATRGKDQG